MERFLYISDCGRGDRMELAIVEEGADTRFIPYVKADMDEDAHLKAAWWAEAGYKGTLHITDTEMEEQYDVVV